MFRNKPTAKNKGKIPVFIRRGVSPKKMFTASSGIFNLEKVQKTRATGTATPARVESQHAKVSDRVFSAGDNGLSMLEAYSEEKVSLNKVALDADAFDYNLFRGFHTFRKIKIKRYARY